MISIRKYMNGDPLKRGQPAAAGADPGTVFYGFATGVLDSIIQHVLSDEQSAPLRGQLLELRNSLRPDWPQEEAVPAVAAVGRILAQQRMAVQQHAVGMGIEIFAMLNQP